MIKTIDLFAGCGGFSTGFLKAGFDIVAAVEFDEQIAKSYGHNHPKTKLYIEDIKNVDNNHVFKEGDADVIIGGPPCQGFSLAGARNREGFVDDPRNYLFKHYYNIVKIVKPKIFIMENVKGLLTMHKGEILRQIISIFENPENFDGQPYKIQYKIFNSEDFGIPQKRERVIIVGTKIDFELDKQIEITKKYIEKEIDVDFFKKVTIEDAISNLPTPTKNGIITGLVSKSKYQMDLSNKNGTTTNHIATNHSKTAVERMRKIKIDENYTSLDEEINSIHSGSYGRMNPFGISTTITTRFDTPSGGRFIHPYEHRTITPREAARIQSFPDSFEFLGSKTSINTQIGNAVPPKLAYFIAIMVRGIL
jgi:DNA (cytosine-5)-methyltransferase 1